MLWRYLKSQVFVLLCGGLVGPIFLIVYFAIGQDDLLKWMFYSGLLITAADVLIALAMTKSGVKSAAKTASLEANGILALAQITGMSETGMRVNDQSLVKLQLHICGSGFTAFDREKSVIARVTRLGNITAGKLVVLVDPTTQDYEIDWERSALVNGLVPAQFTIDEDNKVYDLTGRAGPLMEILEILKANNVSLDSIVDVRSNPVLRSQIHAVVHRATEASAQRQPVAVSGPVDTAPAGSVGERLQELTALHQAGAITDQEYTTKRAQIIAEL